MQRNRKLSTETGQKTGSETQKQCRETGSEAQKQGRETGQTVASVYNIISVTALFSLVGTVDFSLQREGQVGHHSGGRGGSDDASQAPSVAEGGGEQEGVRLDSTPIDSLSDTGHSSPPLS